MDLSSLNLPHHRVLLKWTLAFVGIVVVGAIFWGGAGGLNTLMHLLGQTPITVDDLKGTLILSAISTTELGAGVSTILIDAKDGNIQSIPAGQLTAGSAATLQYSVSSNGARAVFLGTSLASSTKFKTPTIYVADLANITGGDVTPLLQKAAPLSTPTNTDHFRELPVISSIGTVLYSSLTADMYNNSADTLGTIPAENWNIYILHSSGKKQLLTHGLEPKWIDDNRFAYLKNDGIYLYNIVTNESNKVQDLNYAPTLANGFDVSDDGQYVAISIPAINTLSIIRVLDWDSALLASVADIAVTATYPVFSPNDKYLAMLSLEADPNDPTQQTGVGTIKYFSLEKKEFVDTILPLDLSTVAGIYITDWR